MKYTKKDADKVMEQLKNNDPNWGVRVSIDQEYFILSYDGEDVIHDSACDDCYDIDAAAGLFQSYIDEHPTFGERTATLRNLLTGQEIKVHATTEHPDSSYGKPVLVDDDNNAYFQVGTIAPGYEIIEK